MEILVVNAFAEDGFSGNPAGICFVDSFPPDSEMKKSPPKPVFQKHPLFKKMKMFFIRWWTPETEVALCGHATLAAAFSIWLGGRSEPTIRFVSADYELIAAKEKESEIIFMDFPAIAEEPCSPVPDIEEILETEIVHTGRNRFDYMVELRNEKAVAELNPDFEKLKNLDCRGIIVTSSSQTAGYDFVSRFFTPRVGINEGSAAFSKRGGGAHKS